MTTTLRINDELYRKAKSAAASEGITLTRFIEESLQLRLNTSTSTKQAKPFVLHTFDSGEPFTATPKELKTLLQSLDAELDARILTNQ